MRLLWNYFWVVFCCWIFWVLDGKEDGILYIVAAVIVAIIVTILEVFLRNGEERT